MNVLHLICSPRGHASHSASYSRHLVEMLRGGDSRSQVAVRCLNAVTMPHIDRQFSLFSSTGEPGESDGGSLELSNELIAEIIESDAIVLATPMHNLSIPSALKAWIDHVVRPNITFRYSQRKTIGLLEDKPVFVVLSKAEDVWTQDQPDFLRPYLRTMLASIGIRSVEFSGLRDTRAPEGGS